MRKTKIITQRAQPKKRLPKQSRQKNADFDSRKQDHLKISLNPLTQNSSVSGFENIRLIHEALPEINLNEVKVNTSLLGHDFSSPHFVSSMTAGHEFGVQVNEVLASAASLQGWLMAVGSQRKELTQANSQNEWKSLKKNYPKLKLVGNIGAEEIVKNDLNSILQLIENIEAIGLYVHLNPLQEAFQNVNQAQFSGVLSALENLCKKSPVPILVKEVGFGFSGLTLKKLADVGVSIVDVAGHGGTHWGILEGLRNQQKNQMLYDASLAFSGWGYSTVESLQNWQTQVRNNSLLKQKLSVWASGGIRSGVDSAKCLALGAKAVGIAQPLIKAFLSNDKKLSISNREKSVDQLLKVMATFDYQLKVTLFATGVINLNELEYKNILLG